MLRPAAALLGSLQRQRKLPFGSDCYRHWRYLPCSLGINRGCVRNVVTLLEEPPLDSPIPERPCTVALVQDSLYGPASTSLWKAQLRSLVPTEFGMSFANLDLSHEQEKQQGLLALDALQSDLLQMETPQVVLIARGPLVSWWAQLYLESFSLAGLVLVDPLVPVGDTGMGTVIDADAATNQAFQYVADEARKNGSSNYLQNISSLFFSKKRQRGLLLEPGAVPMMVLSTHPFLSEPAQQTAERHRIVYDGQDREDPSNPMFHLGDVPVISMDLGEDNAGGSRVDPLQQCFRDTIGPWIENQVL
ncbi:expressed unknown protein [Seminavis robusta]|uniref:Uncharacterized protein n=1 Tax=Seminavis robusta TaxID=568900 RepID=A0A9N8EBU2_9STRA|nr:expressed unknown protein [Seminavis robusta]|eukprot:Sro896_g217330.1 n/a (304) ;mRNA; r:17756-18667